MLPVKIRDAWKTKKAAVTAAAFSSISSIPAPRPISG
jgi:hypothetical protein